LRGSIATGLAVATARRAARAAKVFILTVELAWGRNEMQKSLGVRCCRWC
jgi:hypothetical protein